MKTIVLAYHNVGCIGIKALMDNGFDIQAVFTHKDKPDENIWFDSVAVQAASYQIPVFAPDDINHPLWVERIRQLKPDIMFSFYYRQLVGQEILDVPPKGCLNLHGSLLPKYRGRCPVNWVLVNGEQETGVSLHYMTQKPDDGDVVAQKRVAIQESDTAHTLFEKLAHASSKLLQEVLPRILTNQVTRVPQDPRQATYFGGRKPQDGAIFWQQDARSIFNLVRAVTRPYPGAFSFLGTRKCLFWQVTPEPQRNHVTPGTVLSLDPLRIACGTGSIAVQSGQLDDGIYRSGHQLASELNLKVGMRFSTEQKQENESVKRKKVLILGVNGFIGSHLSERLLSSGRYEVFGMDLHASKIADLLNHPFFHFEEGDISIMREWIEYHVSKCDIVLPLVAIATPKEYVRNPIRVFELDFEENLRVVRYCVKYGKRLIFPSTSEVYGMCQDTEFDELHSNFVLGPIEKQRWIYSCSKQLLDRVIWAYGKQSHLSFTLFRPFNWIGPRLDSLESARIGSSRVITQFILNLVTGTPIQLVDGGQQKRCFTDVDDGIECLFRIIENPDDRCNGKIFNIGNPHNELSMAELAELLVGEFERHDSRAAFPPFAGYHPIEAATYYGPGYQDVEHRIPSIKTARRILGWQPEIQINQSIEKTLHYFVMEYLQQTVQLA